MPSAADPRAQHPSRRRILIVEDDYLVALQFENALTEAGYEVVDIASTAEEAVQLVPDHQPELVLMDVRLAGPRDGIQAAAEILDRFGVRSIFVSAFSDATTRARADRANPIAWLAKPVADRKLVSTVNTALRDMDGSSDAG
jgi:two-component system, response regulator PdtaR